MGNCPIPPYEEVYKVQSSHIFLVSTEPETRNIRCLLKRSCRGMLFIMDVDMKHSIILGSSSTMLFINLKRMSYCASYLNIHVKKEKEN